MRFVVVGAGSIGLLIGSYLAQNQADVTFWVRREEQARQLRSRLIRQDDTDSEHNFHVQAVVNPEELPTDALWIIAVKYDALHNVLQTISTLPKQPDLLFIQNGIGHLSLIDQYTLGHVSFATVEHGAQRVDEHTVRHNGIGPIIIATNEKIAPTIEWLQAIESENFPIQTQDDAEKLLLRKVLINCAINPLTAILQVRNGQLLDNSPIHLLFRQLCEELLSNFPEVEDVLVYDDIARVCRKTSFNQSSMLVDRLKGNTMEIETIITAVLRKVKQKGGHAPILHMLENMLLGINGRGHNE
ncbi:2-dehydropantoate 2-reductase [Sporosarcina sp. GW1-11]|uniref:ketopantoate reductase family protein n=1 Tax=Sporosarcina sp. GW1-11 TaxID=2899126 RepID=UPI00294EFF48|nr:2-dehydropantoate 2-reductase [Sporosarcina sp. GW1-11]MDV6376808.1 2-dehydropantoate 2-reductase [Sporosarcina sp. GW1-11]